MEVHVEDKGAQMKDSHPYKPLSGREFPRFSQIKTFFRLPWADVQDDFDVALLGIPFDGGVSYRPGARFAPTRVREMSSLGRGYHWSRDISIFDRIRVADVGDTSVVPMSLEQTYQKIEHFVGQLLKTKKRIIAVGGDHSTTLPVLRALRQYYGAPLNFIHFDAHLDTYPAAWNIEYHHGAFARHAVTEGLVDPKNMIQIGLRGPLVEREDLKFVRDHGIRTYTIDDIRERPIQDFVKTLPSFKTGPTYISFDVDALDPSCAPGTGTPVPGGLTSYEAQRILRALDISNLVGADVVEICPAYDLSDLTSLIGVDVMFEFLSLMAKSNGLKK
jgi:guanidinopropionase